MAAAPGLPVHDQPLASPELALVDVALAAELRLGLSLPEDTLLRPRRVFSEVLAERLVEAILCDGLAEPASVTDDFVNEELVGLLDEGGSESQSHSSLCPALPAPEPGDQGSFDATDAALRRIRENFGVEPQQAQRKFRRGFTAASGASALCAFLALVVHLQAGVVHLPGWLHF